MHASRYEFESQVQISWVYSATCSHVTQLFGGSRINIALLSNYMIVCSQRKMLWLQNFDHLQMLVKKYTIQSSSALCKHGILELKDNYVHVKFGPMKHIQGVVHELSSARLFKNAQRHQFLHFLITPWNKLVQGSMCIEHGEPDC